MDPQHHPDPTLGTGVDIATDATSDVSTPVVPDRADTAPVAAPSTDANTTAIGPSIVIRGKLKSSEDLVVRGRIEADIESDKSLHVAQSGIIKATVKVSSARIDGILVGNVTAQERLEIAAEGRVVGDLNTPRIVIREGAAFKGNIEMPNFSKEAGKSDAPPAPIETQPEPEAEAAAESVDVDVDVDIDVDAASDATSGSDSEPEPTRTPSGGYFGRRSKRRRN